MIFELIQILTNAAISSTLIFIPLYAKELNISEIKIGMIVSSYHLASILSASIFGRLSDKYGRKIFIILGLILSSISFYMLKFTNDFLSLLFVRFLNGFFVEMFKPSITSLAYESGINMNKFFSSTSLGWLFGFLLAGIIQDYDKIFFSSSILFLISIPPSLKIKEFSEKVRSVSYSKIILENFKIYFSYLLRHIGASSVWVILPIYLSKIGLIKLQISFVYMINHVFQTIFLRYITYRFGSILSMKIGLVLTSLGMIFYFFTNSLEIALIASSIIGMSWSFLYYGALKFLLDKNIERATSVGLLYSTISLAQIIGSIIGGIISEVFDYRITMIFAALLSIISLLLFR